jgi:hypothetical protein
MFCVLALFGPATFLAIFQIIGQFLSKSSGRPDQRSTFLQFIASILTPFVLLLVWNIRTVNLMRRRRLVRPTIVCREMGWLLSRVTRLGNFSPIRLLFVGSLKNSPKMAISWSTNLLHFHLNKLF